MQLVLLERKPQSPPSLHCDRRFERMRLGRDALLGLALVPASLVFILGGVYATSRLLYGSLTPPFLFGFGLPPLPAALYGVLVFPFVWR